MVLSGEGNPEIYVANSQGRQVHPPHHQPIGRGLAGVVAGTVRGCCSPRTPRAKPQLYVMSATGGGHDATRHQTFRPTARNRTGASATRTRSHSPRRLIAATRSPSSTWRRATSKIVSHAPMDAIEAVWMADGRHVICTFRAAKQQQPLPARHRVRQGDPPESDRHGQCLGRDLPHAVMGF